MSTAWRIVKKRHAGTAFDGEGARLYGGRWNSPGTAVVYTSETRALALLEILVGIRSTKVLSAYVLIPIRFEDNLVTNVDAEQLAEDWRLSPPRPSSQHIGDLWIAEGRSAILRVPSVIVPDEFNFVLNPAHTDFSRVNLGEPRELNIDPRLFDSAAAS
jgi:RES domain-containing protein